MAIETKFCGQAMSFVSGSANSNPVGVGFSAPFLVMRIQGDEEEEEEIPEHRFMAS